MSQQLEVFVGTVVCSILEVLCLSGWFGCSHVGDSSGVSNLANLLFLSKNGIGGIKLSYPLIIGGN